MERISGPYKGFFIAAYTVENDSGYVGYAKVCLLEPDSVWNADPVEKLTSATGYRSELEAIVSSYELAWRMQSNAPDVFDLARETGDSATSFRNELPSPLFP